MSDEHREKEHGAGSEREEVGPEQEEVRREQEEARREQEEEQTSEFQIQIDRVHYTVTEDHLTGAQLRNVPPTPIGSDRDLFEVVLGGPDRKIADAEIVEIRKGMRFFTAPTQINPGCAATR
jgi:hypothetical protein